MDLNMLVDQITILINQYERERLTDFKLDAVEMERRILVLEDQLKEARYAPMGDNHHNAALCPHCGAPLREAQKRIAELEALIRSGSDGK